MQFGCSNRTEDHAGRWETFPRPDTRFRIFRSGCTFGYVVDANTAKQSIDGGWEPDDAAIYEFEQVLSATPYRLSEAYGRQYLGLQRDRIRVMFFCAGDDFPYHRDVNLSLDGVCSRYLEYETQRRRIAPGWHAGSAGNEAAP